MDGEDNFLLELLAYTCPYTDQKRCAAPLSEQDGKRAKLQTLSLRIYNL